MEFAKFHHWLQIELVVVAAGIAGLFIFLFIRSCKRQKGLELPPKANYESPLTDFLDAQINITGIIVSMTVPLFTAAFIKARCNDRFKSDSALEIVNFQEEVTYVQMLSIFYIVFINYHKASERFSLVWIKVGPKIHALLILIDFVVIPIYIVIHFLVNLENIKDSVFTGPLLVYPFMKFI